MYGTIARARLKDGVTEAEVDELLERMQSERPAAAVALTVYRSSSDPRELWICGVFESREAYTANAETAEQNARFERMAALMEGPPEWHDGDVLALIATDRVRSAG